MIQRIVLVLAVLFASAGAVAARQLEVAPGNEHFQHTWERPDQPVSAGVVQRTWMWGPDAFTEIVAEPYTEAPDGARSVQYYDKARMEITQPEAGDPASIWYVTNGLLVVEMTTGNLQLGDSTFEQRNPAQVNVAGDADGATGPTYATFGLLLDASPAPVGSALTQRVDRAGAVTDDPALASQAVTAAILDDVTNHAIASPFWTFMNSSGTIYEAGQYVDEALFDSPYFATGRPISEGYWATVAVAGTPRDVFIQCFERRCLTYTPGNSAGFVVEAGNVGRHYHAWRYDPQPPAPEPTPSPAPSPEPTATSAPMPEPTPIPMGGADFGDGLWMVGIDIEPGIYRNDNTTELCYWARLSGLSGRFSDNIANDLIKRQSIVQIKSTDLAFEADGCGTWSANPAPSTPSPTASFGDGAFFVGSEIAPGLWRNSDSSKSCYWERLSSFGGTVAEVIADDLAEERFVIEISATDAGFTSSRCGTWTHNPGPITASPTADFGGGTYIISVDIQAGAWETDSSPEGCYWARLSGFSGKIQDVIENQYIGGNNASDAPLRVEIEPSDAGFFTSLDCGAWHYAGP